MCVCLCTLYLQSQSNQELKHLLDKHYQNFILLQNSLAAIQASVPVITLLDSEWCTTLLYVHSIWTQYSI